MFFQFAKGLAPILRIVDVCNFAAIDHQMAFFPGSDIDFQLSLPTVRENSWTVAPFPTAKPSFDFQSTVELLIATFP